MGYSINGRLGNLTEGGSVLVPKGKLGLCFSAAWTALVLLCLSRAPVGVSGTSWESQLGTGLLDRPLLVIAHKQLGTCWYNKLLINVPPPCVMVAGVVHFFFNAQEVAQPDKAADLHIRFTLAPCGRSVSFFENLAGLSRDAGGRNHIPFLQKLLLYHDHGIQLSYMPRWVWHSMAEPLALLSFYLLGYRSAY